MSKEPKKKTWLNSKAPPPDWIIYLIAFIGLLWFSFHNAEDFQEGFFIFCFMGFFIWIAYLQGKKKEKKKKKKQLKEVGEEKPDEVDKNLKIIDIIEQDILDISEGSYSRAHLTPPNNRYNGKIQEFWDEAKKKIRYELNFKNGQEHGKWRGWYKNGQLAYEREYRISGFLGLGKNHGSTRVWDKSGKLLAMVIYKNGHIISTK